LAASYKYSSPAAQSLADILLLENSLNVLDRVLDKGQRIVNGLLDILKLYLTQVTYLSLMIVGIALIGIGFPLRGIQLTIVTTVTITIPSLGFTLWANPGVLYGNSLRKSLSHFIIPSAITIAIAGIFTFFYFGGEVPGREYAHLAVTYTLVFMGLLVVLFLRPPFRLLAGGAPLSQDRRMFNMVLVLTGLFFVTVALSAAIPFLFDLLLLEWLTPLLDYVIIIAIVFVWAAALLLIWRVWRIAGLDRIFEPHQENAEKDPPSNQLAEEQIQPGTQLEDFDN
jgi:cation-transporting ATPase E